MNLRPAARRYTGSKALVVRLVDKKQVAASTGMMGDVMRTTVLRTQVRKAPSWPRSWANCSLL
jgi:hypothetical protein